MNTSQKIRDDLSRLEGLIEASDRFERRVPKEAFIDLLESYQTVMNEVEKLEEAASAYQINLDNYNLSLNLADNELTKAIHEAKRDLGSSIVAGRNFAVESLLLGVFGKRLVDSFFFLLPALKILGLTAATVGFAVKLVGY